MKNALSFYGLLLNLYPRQYRKQFAEEMRQTFADNYRDVAESKGGASMGFWLWVIADESRNILAQHVTSLLVEDEFLRVTTGKATIGLAIFFPLYAVFLAALVKAALALPHPHLYGIGVALAFAGIIILPGVLSVVASHLVASALVSVFAKRKVRVA